VKSSRYDGDELTCFADIGAWKRTATKDTSAHRKHEQADVKNLYSRSAEHSSDALVFAKNQGLPFAADNLRKKALRAACKRAGLQRIDWHTFCHTHVTLLHSQGTPLKVAQAQLGHSHMATTLEIYTHASGSAQRDAVNPLEEQLFPNVPKLESCRSIAEKESQLVQ
jgi:integrase